MTDRINVGPIHHLRLTVTDLNRSRDFYTQVLNFEIAVAASPRAGHPEDGLVDEALQGGIGLINGNMLMGLLPAAPSGDQFSENRCGLDLLSFSVNSHADLERAVKILDERGVSHGEIKDL